MAKYAQDSQFKVHTPLKKDSLLLISLEGTEELSRPYCFKLGLAAESSTSVPFDRLLGHRASVHYEPYQGKIRFFSGIISRIVKEGRDDTFTYYAVDLSPHFWLLEQRVQCRIFQGLSVPEILRKVLIGFDVVFQLRGKYPKHNYCVQYCESDLAFASRLMEEEGIYFFFTHASHGEQMVVADASTQSAPLSRESSIIFEEAKGGLRDSSRITSWQVSQKICPSKHVLWDHSFELTGQNLEAHSTVQEHVSVGTSSLSLRSAANRNLSVFDYPGSYAHRFDGVGMQGQEQSSDLQHVFEDNRRTVKIRMEQSAAASVRIDAGGNCPFLNPGLSFKLERHFDANGEYLVTGVRHSMSFPGFRGGISEDKPYENSFTCLPIALPYRHPSETPIPTIVGTQTATVVGPKGEEINTDKHGRVQVQFNWHGSESSSCWVRVGQQWAGQGWGAINIPRVGQEVIVTFLEGDPDAPIVVGSVYNSQQTSPFNLPAEKTRMAAKSRSTPGGDSTTFSGLAIEDQIGSEHVQLHSEKDMTHQTENDHYINTGNSFYHRTQNKRLKHTGSLIGMPGGGGGSGGGGDESSEEEEDYYHGPFDWKNGDVTASIGAELEMVLGISADSVAGAEVKGNVGATVEVFVNPLSFLGEIPGVGKVLQNAFGAAAGVLTGAFTEITFGLAADIVYGPLVEIHHGGKIDICGWEEKTKIPTTIAATLVGATVAANIIEAGLLENEPDTLTDVLIATNVIGGIAGIVLVYLENANCEATHAEELAKETELLAKVTKTSTQVSTTTAQGIAKQAAKSAQEAADSALKAANSATTALSGGSTATAEANRAEAAAAVQNRVHLVNGNFEIACKTGAVLISSTLADGDEGPVGGNIIMNANGNSGTLQGGQFAITATNSVFIYGGEAYIDVNNIIPDVGYVSISSGGIQPASGITLERGPEGRKITINSIGITIDGEAEEEPGIVTIKTAEGAISIILNPEEETVTILSPRIQFTAEEMITMTAPTIAISAADELNVDSASISMEAEADMTFLCDETELGLTPAGITLDAVTVEGEIEGSGDISTLTLELLIEGEGTITVSIQMTE
ncbi:MAG: type VI secretion system tip protein TssI/VgrG [Planctomycetota bacterium]